MREGGGCRDEYEAETVGGAEGEREEEGLLGVLLVPAAGPTPSIDIFEKVPFRPLDLSARLPSRPRDAFDRRRTGGRPV